MGLYYPQQHRKALVGSKNLTTFEISPATLTSAYTGNSNIVTSDYMPQAVIYCKYIPGAGGDGNYVDIKIETSLDGVNFSKETIEAQSVGTNNMYLQERKFSNNGATVALTEYDFKIPIPLADKFFKFSVKETKVGGSDGVFFAEVLLSGK